MPEAQFFNDSKRFVTLLDIKPKRNSQDEKRIRFDFSMPLTAGALRSAPENVKEAFYAVTKDALGLNPVGITAEFQDVKATFFATDKTKTPSLELGGCTLRQLEVSRPDNKVDLRDGDVRLRFHVNLPASRDAWNWGYSNFGSDVCVVFEDLQPLLPNLKAANPDGNGQGILDMERSQAEPTVVKETMPTLPAAQRKAVSKIKTKKKKK